MPLFPGEQRRDIGNFETFFAFFCSRRAAPCRNTASARDAVAEELASSGRAIWQYFANSCFRHRVGYSIVVHALADDELPRLRCCSLPFCHERGTPAFFGETTV